jgi:hypothetical protein
MVDVAAEKEVFSAIGQQLQRFNIKAANKQ